MTDHEKIARFRMEADKARALAAEIKEDHDIGLQLLEIAQKYERLAATLERAEMPRPNADETHRQDIAAMKPPRETESET